MIPPLDGLTVAVSLALAWCCWMAWRQQCAMERRERQRRAALFALLVAQGWDDRRRCDFLLLVGWSWAEIAQAEEDAR